MKRAGDLDIRIAIQRKGTSYNSSGEPVETWTTLATRWSALRPLTGTEINASEQWVAREQTEFTIRWDESIEGVSPLDRIICPSSDVSESPLSARSIYDVIAVHDVGRHDEMKITGARRVG
jgi:head-tail adaptor